MVLIWRGCRARRRRCRRRPRRSFYNIGLSKLERKDREYRSTHATIPTIRISAAFSPKEKHDPAEVLARTVACAMLKIVATPEFARTWTWLRAPSPPSVPVAERVKRALMSCFTCHPQQIMSAFIPVGDDLLDPRSQVAQLSNYLGDLGSAKIKHSDQRKGC